MTKTLPLPTRAALCAIVAAAVAKEITINGLSFDAFPGIEVVHKGAQRVVFRLFLEPHEQAFVELDPIMIMRFDPTAGVIFRRVQAACAELEAKRMPAQIRANTRQKRYREWLLKQAG